MVVVWFDVHVEDSAPLIPPSVSTAEAGLDFPALTAADQYRLPLGGRNSRDGHRLLTRIDDEIVIFHGEAVCSFAKDTALRDADGASFCQKHDDGIVSHGFATFEAVKADLLVVGCGCLCVG